MHDDDEARALLARAQAGVASGSLVGRNEPCPCGSGKRYKQCHGAISASATSISNAGLQRPSTAIAGQPLSLSAATLAQQGLVAHQRGDIDTAERAYRAALVREAEHPLALHYLGVVLHQRGRHAEALPLLERSASLVPAEPEFHNNLGLVFAALDDNDRAIDSYRRALERKPDHATAWNNLGLACQAANRLPEAIASFRRALALTPGFAQAHWNLALALLANGEYAEGWREYEWRLRLPELGGHAPSLTIPRWEGEDMRGRTLLVTAEQGIGDALQFIRFVARLAERGVRVVVQAPPKLCALLATAPGVAATVSPGDPLPAYDGEIPLLSLPHRLGILANDLAAPVRYLHSDPLWHADVGAELARTGARTRNIGIAWAGAAHYRNDARRSMPLALLAPLLSLPGTTWYSLQKGPAESQTAQVSEARRMVPLDPVSDLPRDAALVDALDAVVSVDTSIAHLAGALGKPVFVLLPYAPDWRWGIAGNRTPWYPTARLFRQPAIGDWPSAVASLHAALR